MAAVRRVVKAALILVLLLVVFAGGWLGRPDRHRRGG